MMPLGRGRENSASGVFFTVPCAVAMNTKWFSSNSFTGTTAVIFSPSSSGNMLTIGLPRAERLPCRHLVHLEPVELAAVGEAQQVVVRVRDEQALDEIVLLHRGRGLAAAAAALRAVLGERLRLDVAAVRERDHHVLRRDQVLDRDVLGDGDDLAAALVAELLLQLASARSSMICVMRAGLARMSSRSAMVAITSRYSSRILSCSRPVRRCSRSSRIACACASDRW